MVDSESQSIETVSGEDYLFEYRFPYPLADLYRRYRVAHTSVDRLGYLLAAGEASLKFLVSVAFACRGETPELRAGLASIRSQLESPSFGTWRQMLEAARSFGDPGVNTLESSLFGCIRNMQGGASRYLNAIQVVVEQRNLYVHGGVVTADVAEAIIPQVLPKFREAFRELAFLGRTHLIFCEEVRWLGHPKCFEAVVRMCSGCNPIFPYELWRLQVPLAPQTPYLVSADLRTAYGLRPLLLIRSDDRLRLPHSYFYFHARKTPVWHTYEMVRDIEHVDTPEVQKELTEVLAGNRSDRPTELQFVENRPAWQIGLGQEQSPTLSAGYSMLGQIGEGRYATVYRVIHTGMRETRAYKVLKPEAAREPRVRKRLEIEAQALSKLRDARAAIELYEYGETPAGLPYLVLELADGGSLEESLRRWGPKSWQDVLQIGQSGLLALETIHNAGIIHRDIKPSNILFVNGDLRFCDFGVCRFGESDLGLTVDGDAIGTPMYMAPEQQRGYTDARSDIFSFGVCLVHLLGCSEANPRTYLHRDYRGPEDFGRALLNFIEPIGANRPPSAAAALVRLEGMAALTHGREGEAAKNRAISGGAERAEARPKGKAEIWRSSDGTTFRGIPKGEFLMGGTKYPDERPVHEVTIRTDLFVATTLVTNRQFEEFVRRTNYRGRDRRFLVHLYDASFQREWTAARCPVVFVSWQDAREYALWRSELEDRDYRLPTEAEWEYSCRAGTRTVYPWGNEYDGSRLNADDIHGHPTAVGSYPPNHWGIFDMLGNVWEWCEDSKDVTPKEESIFYRQCAEMESGACVDPLNSGDDALLSQKVRDCLKVVRGGSFHSKGRNCRPANRRGQDWKDCVRSIGFRLVVCGPPLAEVVTLE